MPNRAVGSAVARPAGFTAPFGPVMPIVAMGVCAAEVGGAPGGLCEDVTMTASARRALPGVPRSSRGYSTFS